MSATIRTVDRTEWQRLAPSFLDYNYRQVWDFGVACAKRLNATSEHIIIEKENEVIALADVRIKRIPIIGGGIAYINGGPLVRRCADDLCQTENLKVVLEVLRKYYVNDKKLVLRIQPPLGPGEWNDLQSKIFQDMGFEFRGQSNRYRTIVLDISPPLEMVRKQFHQKWRNCLNNAEKRDLIVKTGTDEKSFATFVHLYQEFISRKTFDINLSPQFYFQVQKRLINQERFLISIVYKDDQPIAGHVSSILGDTCVYLLGATNGQGLKNKAAYIVQWSVIQAAREAGCQFYDLGGIDPEKNPGVYRFKKRMGGETITASGPFEYCPNGLRRILVHGCEKAFKILRSLRKN